MWVLIFCLKSVVWISRAFGETVLSVSVEIWMCNKTGVISLGIWISDVCSVKYFQGLVSV